MSTLDKDTVRHVALLSRLSLNDEEVGAYCSQLASILSYISKLNEIDTRDTLPTSHAVSGLKNVFRPDTPAARGGMPSLSVDEALENAPAREGDFFKVPQIIEGK